MVRVVSVGEFAELKHVETLTAKLDGRTAVVSAEVAPGARVGFDLTKTESLLLSDALRAIWGES